MKIDLRLPKIYVQWIAVFCMSLLLADAFAAEDSFGVSAKPPPGFESLLEEQTTLVDVYYSNELIATALATYDLTTITFDDPDNLVSALADINDVDTIVQALSVPLDHNKPWLCDDGLENERLCLPADPDVVAVVFDDSRFRVDIIVNRLYRNAQAIKSSRFLPLPERKFSILSNYYINATGDSKDSSQITANVDTLYAYGNSRLINAWFYSSDTGIGNDAFSLQYDRSGWIYEAGSFLLDEQYLGFVDSYKINGVRIGRSLDLLANSQLDLGLPIFIFLNERARVDIFKGERLIDSKVYNAGNQQLDTANLPYGAYTIKVAIRQKSGAPIEETHYFVKSGLLPPKDFPLYELSIGNADKQNSAGNAEWFNLNTVHRLSNAWGVNAGLYYYGDGGLFQTGLNHIGKGYQLQTSVMSTTTGDSGFAINGQLATNKFSAGFDYRNVRTGDNVSGQELLIDEAFTQTSFTMGMPIGYSGNLRAQLQRYDNESGETRNRYGVNYFQRVWEKGDFVFYGFADYIKDQADSLFRLGVDVNWNRDPYLLSSSAGWGLRERGGNKDNGPLINAQVNRSDEFGAGNTLQSTGYINQDLESNQIGVRTDFESHFGSGSFEASNTNSEFDGNRTSYNMNLRAGSAFVNGRSIIGGQRNDHSGIVVEVEGELNAHELTILVDRQPRNTVKTGKRTIILLPPYQTYDIRLADVSKSLINYDTTPRKVTLYPGNVVDLTWGIEEIIVLITQLVTPEGEPLASARVTNVDTFAATDEQGWIQIEISQEKSLVLKNKDINCEVIIPELEAEQDVAVLDTLVCNPI